MDINQELLSALVFHNLKSLLSTGGKIEPKVLEHVACQSFGLRTVGGKNLWADGVNEHVQASIKTRYITPKIKAKKTFQTDPDKFLGYQFNHKQKTVTAGIELIQRRQVVDESKSPKDIGTETINRFLDNVEQSRVYYDVDSSYEVILVHGYDCNSKHYLVSVYWQEYKPLNPKKLIWAAEKGCVVGYESQKFESGVQNVKMCLRYNGNVNRLATNFVEYKNPAKYTNSVNVSIPLPDAWEFDLEKTLAEIDRKEQQYATSVSKKRSRSLSK